MKSDPRRYAPIGLVLSGLALVSAIGVGVLKVFEGAGMFTAPDPALLGRILYISISVIIAGLAIFALLDPDRVRKFTNGRQAQYGSNSLVMLLAFVGILVVVNMLVFQNPKRWDVTEDKEHTLAPETMEALTALPEPVLATGFYSTMLNSSSTESLFEDFKASSGGKFNYRFMDPNSNPVFARELGITGDGKILLQMGEAREIVTFASEQEITAGLIRLMNPQKPVIYFLTGDGEHDTENPSDEAYYRARSVLESKNYIVKTLNLQAENAIPEDARVIVVAGPLVPLPENAITLIKNYLDTKGSLVVLTNPVPLTQIGDQPDLLANYLAENWGITLNNDIVIDTESPSSAFHAVGAQYNIHPITEKMQGIAAIFPYARSLTTTPGVENVNLVPLVFTVERSWGETDYAALQSQQLAFDAGADLQGPMLLVAAGEHATTKARLVVFGNSTFAQDAYFDSSGNGDILINAIDWAAEQENLINLTTSEATLRTFDPPGNTQVILMIVTSICLIPLTVIGFGIYNWAARRRRG